MMPPGTILQPRPHPADGQLVPPQTGGAPGRTPRQDRSPTPPMNGDTTLAVSEGQLPANSRHATSTRESQSGSGSSHDPAPAHHPHPPRSPPSPPSPAPAIGGPSPVASRPYVLAPLRALRLDPTRPAPPTPKPGRRRQENASHSHTHTPTRWT